MLGFLDDGYHVVDVVRESAQVAHHHRVDEMFAYHIAQGVELGPVFERVTRTRLFDGADNMKVVLIAELQAGVALALSVVILV